MRCDNAVEVVKTLQRAGHQAVFAGGAVRDRLLGRDPHDYDVATDATPDEVMALFPKAIPVGVAFGVVRVVSGGSVVEVATFRRDAASSDHRRPDSVEFASMADDASRRDFTLNALFWDPVADRVYDYVGGQRDLESRTLRFAGPVGDAGRDAMGSDWEYDNAHRRVDEDALRLLRAVRFMTRFDLTPDPQAERVLEERAADLRYVSPERVREELGKMLTGPRAGDAVRRMAKYGFLRYLLPEVDALRGVEQPPEFHPEGDVFDHTCVALDHLPKGVSERVAFAVLFHDVGKPGSAKFDPKKDRVVFHGHDAEGAKLLSGPGGALARMRFSNADARAILWLVLNHMRAHNFLKMDDVKKADLLQSPYWDDLMAVAAADGSASVKGDLTPQVHMFVAQAPERLFTARPLVSGTDLKAMGAKPGPFFRRVLDKVREGQIKGRIQTRDQALDRARMLLLSYNLI